MIGNGSATEMPAPVSGNAFNAANQMTSFNGTALSYDANGNPTSDGTNIYAWDARNHQVAISGPTSRIVKVFVIWRQEGGLTSAIEHLANTRPE